MGAVREPAGSAEGCVEKCTGCNLCVRECSFLRRAGNPKEIAAKPQACDPFECTLCGLCAAVCPVGVDPSRYFLQRRRGVRRERGDDPRHSPLIAYERKGTSRLFTFYGLPEGCDTVFFPGCALPGTRPGAVTKAYDHLRQRLPSLGIVLDCCLKPSHDLGREEHFAAVFGEMREYLSSHGIRKVLVACPNCHRMFSEHGGVEVQTVYELLGEGEQGASAEVVMHDPCVSRFVPAAQEGARKLAESCGVRVVEMAHSGERTLCCGRGGGVNFIRPEVVEEAVASRVAEAEGRPVLTYCASCAGTFGGHARSLHLLDLWGSPQDALAGKVPVARAPFTYLNRLRLKRRLRKGNYAVTRERELPAATKGLPRPLVLFLALAGAAAAVRGSGASALLEPDTLRQMVGGMGYLGPLLFIALYTVTPVLFLPGIPMALAAGILFGPFWGVVYAIIGATLGACASFLVARYAAREWVAAKLTGEMWGKLDRQVGEQGWKIVAVTRLIPLFPFNLLNYAFGLTRIPFLHYAVASFFCMLPGCIAFIVFSSSLPQLLKGKISPAFIAGAACMAAVSLAPVWYRRRAGR
ncbi:MAG TPA: VTT domain-containing protein [Verrucomicrobiae bacterium]|nr:VTT domain-containing protein [Verrucomicrobiae bacterium]